MVRGHSGAKPFSRPGVLALPSESARRALPAGVAREATREATPGGALAASSIIRAARDSVERDERENREVYSVFALRAQRVPGDDSGVPARHGAVRGLFGATGNEGSVARRYR